MIDVILPAWVRWSARTAMRSHLVLEIRELMEYPTWRTNAIRELIDLASLLNSQSAFESLEDFIRTLRNRVDAFALTTIDDELETNAYKELAAVALKGLEGVSENDHDFKKLIGLGVLGVQKAEKEDIDLLLENSMKTIGDNLLNQTQASAY